MENYKLQGPSEDEYRELRNGDHYVEIWRGLPNLDFKKAKSREGYDSLCCEQSGNYIWVGNDAVKELKINSNAILVAHLSKTRNEKINAWLVDKPKKLLEDRI